MLTYGLIPSIWKSVYLVLYYKVQLKNIFIKISVLSEKEFKFEVNFEFVLHVW